MLLKVWNFVWFFLVFMCIDIWKKFEIVDVSKIIECIVFLLIIVYIVWLNIYDIIGIFKILL